MNLSRFTRAGTVGRALCLATTAIVLAGCGASTIHVKATEKSISDYIDKQTGFRPTDLKCPKGEPARTGTKFDCTFTGPEPQPYVAHVRVHSVSGGHVELQISAVPAHSGGPETLQVKATEQTLSAMVARQTKFHPTDMRCPQGIPAKVGTRFDCSYTGPEPKPYVAHVRVATVRGVSVNFDVQTAPKR
jgi:hypothetical protein